MKSTELTAVVVAASLMVGGTYAWQSFSQEYTNEGFYEAPDVGGRLHDYYDGKNKDIFVENYGSVENDDSDVFARIRLDEYMEMGTDAGLGTNVEPGGIKILRGDLAKDSSATPELFDQDTWDTYLFNASSSSEIRDYHDLVFGGSTVFMPTFNKNKDSLEPEVNGTIGVRADRTDDYTDYVTYTVGQTITADAVYDADDNTEVEETHTGKNTLSASVISMSSWLSGGCKLGAFWVYDVDGWAYWAQPIEPETATGLLLTEIEVLSKPAEDWYYGVHVVCQIASAGDWGDEANSDPSSSMYASDMTVNGLYVLNKAAGLVRFSGLGIVDEDGSAATTLFDSTDGDFVFGESHDYGLSEYTVINGNENDPDTHKFTWSVKDSDGNAVSGVITSDGVFTPTDKMGGIYTITVTSVLDSSKSASITVEIIGLNIFGLTTAATDALIGTDTAVTVVDEDVEFYILDKQTVTEYTEDGVALGDKEAYLIFAKNYELTTRYHTSDVSIWSISEIKLETLPNWLSGYNYLSSVAVRTKIETDGYYTSDVQLVGDGKVSVDTSYDNVFLLSQPQLINYITLGDSRAAATGSSSWWLRSPCSASNVRRVSASGLVIVDTGASAGQGIRPALWVEPYL